ncbi:MAG: MmcQ/YjbR family DNA-binding protein, partial [Dinghuibacter sp.]|nr:MmcQ/YjbR family DNA-binding protein [Dinghuibacter sp.]
MFIDQLRSITAKLPGVTEEVKWENDLCFCVAGKMFCVAP